MAEVDPDQAAALRRLRATFGFVEILRIVDHDGQTGKSQVAGGVLRRYTTCWRWFG
jgi:hypothetical protein